jgi:hypothetical protein
MPRTHIDYLQSQSLPWQPSRWPHLPGCQLKILSRDPDGGAVSLLVRYPSGWQAPNAGCLSTAEELLVLDGTLEFDGRRYQQDCYGWFPPGCRHSIRAAPYGAVALTFYAAEPAWTQAPQATAQTRPAEVVIFIDAFELPWVTSGPSPVFGGTGQHWKVLRGPPHAGAATMLIASAPHLHPPRWFAPQEIHECAEEMFVLSGDFLSHAGPMSSGAYVWRPPGVAHGPYGSRGGNLALIRIHAAVLASGLTPHQIELPRAPEYQPVLPPELGALRSYPWRPQRY